MKNLKVIEYTGGNGGVVTIDEMVSASVYNYWRGRGSVTIDHNGVFTGAEVFIDGQNTTRYHGEEERRDGRIIGKYPA